MNIGVSYIETSLYCEKLQLFILCENLEAVINASGDKCTLLILPKSIQKEL